MDFDEIVETSDVEELEEDLRLRATLLHGGVERRRPESAPKQTHSPPRKRLKLFHEDSNSPVTESFGRLSVSPVKSLLPIQEPTLSESSPTAFDQDSPRWPLASSRSPSYTSVEEIPNSSKYGHRNSSQSDLSQDPLLLYSPTQPLRNSITTPLRAPLASLPLDENPSPIFGSPVTRPNPSTPQARTPPFSPQERLHVSVADPYSRLRVTHTPSLLANTRVQNVDDNGNMRVLDSNNDNLLLFTPTKTKPSSNQTQSSPLTPITPRPITPLSFPSSPAGSVREVTLTPSSDPASPSPSALIVSEESAPPPPPPANDVQNIDAVQIPPEESRYSLRKRNIAQINPYTIENLQYKRLLQSNPEAIVKMKALEHLNHRHPGNHYEEEGGTQMETYLDEGVMEDEGDASWEQRERRRLQAREEKDRRRRERESRQVSDQHDKTNYPGILQDLSDSDEDGMAEIEREARRVAKRKEKEEKENLKAKQREKDAKARKAKRFPVSLTDSSTRQNHGEEHSGEDVEMEDSTEQAAPARTTSTRDAEDHILRDYFKGYDESDQEMDDSIGPSSSNKMRISSVQSPPTQNDTFADLFGDDMGGAEDIYQDNWQGGEDQLAEDVIPRGSSRAPYTIESDEERSAEEQEPSHTDGKMSDIEFDLPGKKSKKGRLLLRMYPKFMLEKLGTFDSGPRTSKKTKGSTKRAKSTPISDDDPAPLLPGQTRVQKSANPKAIRDIKGDSETEPESEGEDQKVSTTTSTARVATRHEVYESDADSDVVEIVNIYRPRATRVVQKPHIFQEDSSAEDEVDDEDLEDLYCSDEMDGKIRHDARMRNEDLIDFMLARHRTIGGSRKSRPRVAQKPEKKSTTSAKPPKPRLDIVTSGARGYGTTRQTLLDFSKPQNSKKHNNREKSRSMSRVSSSHSIRNNLGSSGHRAAGSGQDPGSRSKHRTGSTHHRSSAGRGSGPSSSSRTYGTSRKANDEDEGAYNPMTEVIDITEDLFAAKKASWKEREKERKKRAKTNGIWSNNTTSNQIITSGVDRSLATRIVEQEDASRLERRVHLSFAPRTATPVQREHWSKQFKPPSSPPRRIRKGPREALPDEDAEDDRHGVAASRRALKSPKVDMGVCMLPAGKAFAGTTSIGKGWLYDLINSASGAQDPVRPLSTTLLGYSLDPEMELASFCAMLPQITDSFFDFVTALPDLDSDQEVLFTQWTTLAHAVSQHISWFLRNGGDQATTALRDAVETQILRIIDQTKRLAPESIDTPIMALAWYSVEMSVRVAAQRVPNPAANKLLKTSSTLLMDLLLQFDMRKTMKPVLKSDSVLDGSRASHFSAELWVCLIHSFTPYVPKEVVAPSKAHPFWPALVEVVRMRAEKATLLPVAASEDAWYTIFSLCALSQFSVHGMTMGQVRLPASWDAVIFALRKIDMESAADEIIDEATRQRDKYIAIVVKRCLHLHERWDWKLHDPSALFNELAAIFRSRKFADLQQERGDFPDFLKEADSNLLSSFASSDTSFVTFLKLIVRAAHEDPIYVARKSSPKVKKWLSMAVPVGNVSLPKHTDKEKDEEKAHHHLSMFYNRFAAVAVAVELDPAEYDDRTEKARHYIKFANADPTTRVDIIRGIIYWGRMTVARNVKLTAILAWISETATTIGEEFTTHYPLNRIDEQVSERQKQIKKRVALFVNIVVYCVCKIVKAHIEAKIYPDPALIGVLKPVLTEWSRTFKGDMAIRTLQTSFGSLLSTFFDARHGLVPPPPRPPLIVAADEESQESQDFGMDDYADLDWDNIDVPALAADSHTTGVPAIIAEDQRLFEALKSVHFKWTIRPLLLPCLQPPPEGITRTDHENECDKWIRLFMCYFSLDTRAEKWSECLSSLDDMIEETKEKDTWALDSWTGRVRLSIMYQLLKLDPMGYMTTEDRAMDAFLLALVSDHVTLEKAYVEHFLSIAGLRHSFLHGVTDLPAKNEESGDFAFSTEEFSDIRIMLLKTILQNVNELVHQQLRGNEYIQKSLESIHKMLSTMRGRLNSLEAPQRRNTYAKFCYQVYIILKDCPELSAHEKLKYWWSHWGPGLTHNA